MNWLSHLSVALLLFLLFWWLGFVSFTPALLALLFLGALMPDIDHEKSKITKTFFAALFVLLLVLFLARPPKLLALAGKALESTMPAWFLYFFAAVVAWVLLYAFYVKLKPRHRGVTHSLAALLVFSVLVYALFLRFDFAFAGGLGYFSHLLADCEMKLA